MTESDKGPKSVEDNARLDHSVVVQLSEILDRRYPLLVVLEAVDLWREDESAQDGRRKLMRPQSNLETKREGAEVQRRRRTHLHSDTNVLQNFVNHSRVEFRMIPSQIVQQHRKQMNVAELDLPDLRECAV